MLVPITVDKNIEDSSMTYPAQRLQAFGQKDHLRSYGPDYIDRLRNAGFAVKITKVNELINAEDVIRMGLTEASGDIYYCTHS